jgi:hypothetical protein
LFSFNFLYLGKAGKVAAHMNTTKTHYITSFFFHKLLIYINPDVGYGDYGNPYWQKRYETVFSRMEAIGLKFVGPQFPDGGIQAIPYPNELPVSSKNVPTFRPKRISPNPP